MEKESFIGIAPTLQVLQFIIANKYEKPCDCGKGPTKSILMWLKHSQAIYIFLKD